jgi:hypothetical protein
MKQHCQMRIVGVIILCLQLLGKCDANVRNLFSLGRNGHNNNNNNEKDGQRQDQRRQRRRLTEEGSSGGGAVGRADVHIDAATGTVPHLVSAGARARESASQTCDGQMAAALVRANQLATVAEQERDSAIARHAADAGAVAALEGTVAQLKAALEAEKLAHEQDVQTAAQLLDVTKEAASQTLQETKEEARRVLVESQEESRRAMADLKTQHTSLLKMRKEEAEAELESLRTEKDDIIASLQTKLKMTSDDLQRKLQEELEKARADRDSTLADLKAKMEAAIAEVENDRDSKLADLVDKMDSAIAALEKDRDAKIAALEVKMQDAATEASRVLQTTKEEAKAYMLRQVSAVTDELVQTKLEHEKSLSSKNEKIKNLEDYTKKMMEKKSDIEHSLLEAMSVSRERHLCGWDCLHYLVVGIFLIYSRMFFAA